MKISATIFVILISTCIVNASVLDPVIENVVHLKASKPPSGVAGIWKKKTIWKPRWVKEWKSAKVMKPVWKKVWSPVQIREWVPIPKPPPGWDSISTPLASLQKAPIKDSTRQNSFTVHSSAKIPLWDPIPYPESQQPPPPPPFPQSLHDADSSCDNGICDNSHSGTFNHQQISEIIGPKYAAPEYFQNAQHSETINHLTRLPPHGNNWRPPLPDSQTDDRFSSFPVLPEFLVPPMFQSLPSNNFRLQPNLNHQPFFNHIPIPREHSVGHSSAFEAQNGLRQWTSFPPEMKIKGHFVTKAPDHPYKFQFPEMEKLTKNGTETTRGETFSSNESKEVSFQRDNINSDFRPQADGDIVQEAHLVGEYHYSEIDLPNFKHESKKPQPSMEEKDRVNVKPQQKVKAVPDVQKHKTTHHPQEENKQGQDRTETERKTHHPQNSQHVQKKHIPHSPSNTSNVNFIYQQQKSVLKDILPSYNPPLVINETFTSLNHGFAMTDYSNKHLPINLPSTLLLAVEPEPRFNSSGTNANSLYKKGNYPVPETPQIQTKIPPNERFSQPSNSVSKFGNLAANSGIPRQKQYPVYKAPPNSSIIPNNHRFSPPMTYAFNASTTNAGNPHHEENYPAYVTPEISTTIPPNHKLSPPLDTDFQDKPPRPNHYTAKSPQVVPNEVTKTEKPLLERYSRVQLVFPTTDEVPPEAVSKLNTNKITTTEPYSVIFSSSLLSKAEAVSKSPVVIVTPIIRNKS